FRNSVSAAENTDGWPEPKDTSPPDRPGVPGLRDGTTRQHGGETPGHSNPGSIARGRGRRPNEENSRGLPPATLPARPGPSGRESNQVESWKVIPLGVKKGVRNLFGERRAKLFAPRKGS